MSAPSDNGKAAVTVVARVSDERTMRMSSTPQWSIFPPFNFGMVEEDLTRSGEPNELNFPFLEKLKLSKVIWLAPEEPSEKL